MNNINQKIIDNIVSIDIKRNLSLLGIDNEIAATFILVGSDINVSSKKQNDVFKVDKNIYNTFESLEAITLSQNEIEIEDLRKTILTYFLEGGNNLYIVNKKTNKLPDNINFTVGINLFKNSGIIDTFLENNKEKNIFWISPSDLSNNFPTIVFKLECKDNHFWVAHTAAYLNNLTLDKPIKDYCYTQVNSFVPDVNQTIELTVKQEWTKNQIINIAGKGIVVGGELNNGLNLVNEYILMLINKRLQRILVNELLNKPTRGQIVGKIQNSLTNELNKFYSLNAIEPGIYTGITKSITYNNEVFEYIQNGEYLQNGYKLFIVDILKSTEEDIKNHKMTPIVLLLNQQNQIRFIKLNMEVL